jgi:hypothetical protein
MGLKLQEGSVENGAGEIGSQRGENGHLPLSTRFDTVPFQPSNHISSCGGS